MQGRTRRSANVGAHTLGEAGVIAVASDGELR